MKRRNYNGVREGWHTLPVCPFDQHEDHGIGNELLQNI